MKRFLHVCGNVRSGGIRSFVTWIAGLNHGQDTIHDILLIFEGAGEIDGNRYGCTVHRLHFKKTGFLAAMRQARQVCRRYDAFLIHTAHPVVVLPLLTLRRPSLLFQHGMAVSTGSGINRFLKRMWYTLIPVLLRAHVVCSTTFASDKIKRLGIFVRRKRIVITPFGVPVKRTLPAASRDGLIRVGMAGNLVGWKRHHLVLESLAGYSGRHRIQLAIAGQGPEEARLVEIARRIEGDLVQIEFKGLVREMDSFYNCLDLIVIPSRGESFGLVALEALCRGLPLAVFEDVGGCLSLINDGVNGFVMRGGLDGLRNLWSLLDDNPNTLDELKRNICETDLEPHDIGHTRLALEELAVAS